MQTPSLGRIVLVPCDTTVNNGADVAPAVITRVWGEHPEGWTVNLRVLLDGAETPWRTSQILCESEDRARDLGKSTAWWPPRV